MIIQAIRFGLISENEQVRHSASVLRSGKWKSKSTGQYIPAQPGFGPATLPELNRCLDLIGEEETYRWAKQQPELTGFVKLWDMGRFHTFKGEYLAPQTDSVVEGTRKGVPAERRAKVHARSLADKKKHLEKTGGKKKKGE